MTNLMEIELKNKRLPEQCTHISEVREEIDSIDKAILKLFAVRYDYVKHIVNFKNSKEGIVAKDRQNEVFTARRKWAEELGLDPDLFEKMYKMLIDFNINKEMQLFEKHNNK